LLTAIPARTAASASADPGNGRDDRSERCDDADKRGEPCATTMDCVHLRHLFQKAGCPVIGAFEPELRANLENQSDEHHTERSFNFKSGFTARKTRLRSAVIWPLKLPQLSFIDYRCGGR
jgi:hypothetical protein